MIHDFQRRLDALIARDKGSDVSTFKGVTEHYARMGVDADSMATAALAYVRAAGVTQPHDQAVLISLMGRFLEIGIQIGTEQTEARLS